VAETCRLSVGKLIYRLRHHAFGSQHFVLQLPCLYTQGTGHREPSLPLKTVDVLCDPKVVWVSPLGATVDQSDVELEKDHRCYSQMYHQSAEELAERASVAFEVVHLAEKQMDR